MAYCTYKNKRIYFWVENRFLIRLSNVNRPLFKSSFKSEYWCVFKCTICWSRNIPQCLTKSMFNVWFCFVFLMFNSNWSWLWCWHWDGEILQHQMQSVWLGSQCGCTCCYSEGFEDAWRWTKCKFLHLSWNYQIVANIWNK